MSSASHSSTGKLLAAVPELLDFAPADSLVVVGLDVPHGQVILTLRYDVPDAPDTNISTGLVSHTVGVLTAQHAVVITCRCG